VHPIREPSTAELDELVHPDRVHRSLYTDREVFVREMERVYGGT
jgi:hypothetical protein